MRIGVKPGQWGWTFDELTASWQVAIAIVKMRSPNPPGAGSQASVERKAPPKRGSVSLLPDLGDGCVQDDVSLTERELSLLGQLRDLVVLHQQNLVGSRLPGDEDLLPERVVVALARLGSEHRELTVCRVSADEVLRWKVLAGPKRGREVDVHRRRLRLAGDVGHKIGVLVSVVEPLECRHSLLRNGAEMW